MHKKTVSGGHTNKKRNKKAEDEQDRAGTGRQLGRSAGHQFDWQMSNHIHMCGVQCSAA